MWKRFVTLTRRSNKIPMLDARILRRVNLRVNATRTSPLRRAGSQPWALANTASYSEMKVGTEG